MVTQSQNAPLTREEREFWLKSFLAYADRLSLARTESGSPLSAQGAAHLCSEFAWAALDAYRKAVAGDRS